MSKSGPQCKIGNKETKALAKALESSYPVNEKTILAKIESFQVTYDKDPMYVPSVPEMKTFLDVQASKGDLVVPMSQLSKLEKQVKEGTATMQQINGSTYIATKNGMIIKILPNKTPVIINPSDTSEEGILLHQAFDTFFSNTNEVGPEEDVKEDKNTGIFATTKKKEYWGRSAVEKDTETLYIFTDNTDRDSGSSEIDPNSKYAQKYGKNKHYPKVTAAVIRGLDNAMPISTQRWYHDGAKGNTGMWQDADAEEFEKVIKEEVDSIIEEWKSGKYKKVVIPSGDGFFGEGSRSISKINKTRVPELYRILTEQLTRLEEAIGKDNISPFTKNTDMQTSSIEIPGVKLKEDTEKSYLSRTRQNAEWSDVTIALGEDLTTAGELQTAKLAGAEVVEEERTNARGEKYTTVTRVTNPKKGKYVGINLNTVSSAEAIATEIYNQIVERGLPTKNIKLNIAGNGIYTLKSDQTSYDTLLTNVLKALQDKGVIISEVRSGGQTGIDEAGIKAAVSLGLKASILAPKGYKFRGKDNKDISNKELFIKRFNPDYKEPKKTQRKKAEVLYEDDEITEAKKKAKEFTLISSTQLGANSAWKIAGENYGIEAIQMSNTETYDDLSADERASLELPYHQAMVALKRNEIKLTNASANKATIRVGKLGRMLYTQVKNSDGVFIISELVDAGANAHSFVQGKQGRKNEAKFAVAAGSLNSIATYHAMQMKKPLHVYDECRDSWMTYDYTKEEWVKEDTPILTKKALTFGREGSKNGRGFDETIGEKNWKAIRDVMHKTFGWVVFN